MHPESKNYLIHKHMKTIINYNKQEFDYAISFIKKYNHFLSNISRAMLEESVMDAIRKFENGSVNIVQTAGLAIVDNFSYNNSQGTLVRDVNFYFDVKFMQSLFHENEMDVATDASSNAMLPEGLIQDEV